jgi:hypothetical protein
MAPVATHVQQRIVELVDFALGQWYFIGIMSGIGWLQFGS